MRRVYSSAVERLTADQQVPGSNPGAPFHKIMVSPKRVHNYDSNEQEVETAGIDPAASRMLSERSTI